MKIKLTDIDQNPFRDFTANPLDKNKVAGLKESIEDTDFWDNVLLRSHPTVEGRFQLAYGHNRLAALEDLGWDEIDVPVKDIDDDTMLKIMANENKDDWGSSILVMMETTRQVRDTLNAQVIECKNFDEYSKKFSFFRNTGDFGNAKKQGVGYRRVKEFLGDTWSENDIKYAFNALNTIDAGLIMMSDVKGIGSAGLLNRFTTMVKQITDNKDLPLYLKEQFIDGVRERVTDPENAPSVKTMTRTRDIIKKGCDPIKYLDSGKHANIDIIGLIVKLLEGGDTALVDDGFEGFEKDIEEAKAKIVKKAERQAKLDAGEELPPEEPITEAAEAEAAALAESIDSGDVDMGDLGDIDVSTPEATLNIAALASTFIKSVPTFALQARKLFGRADKLDDDKLNEAAIEAFKHSTILVLELFGKAEAKDMIEEFEKQYLANEV